LQWLSGGNDTLRYVFDDFALDTERRELRRGADLIAIAPRVFDLIDFLLRNRARVVSKDDLIEAVWNGRVVSDAALTTRLNAARRALGDDGSEQRLVKTLPRRGFRFVAEVREVSLGENGEGPEDVRNLTRPARPQVAEKVSIVSPRHLSIVVLPLINLSGGTDYDYFVDGVTESLTTDLSRIAGSFVIGRSTAFSFRDKPVDVRKLGLELNVRYVLEGSVQRGKDRVRINVRLVEVQTANQVWAERFDQPIVDLFDMQDAIVSRLANTLDTQLVEAEARRAERSLQHDAMDLYFQGRSYLNKGITPDFIAQAQRYFERVLAIDPGHVDAAVSMAQARIATGASFFTETRENHLEAAEKELIGVLGKEPRHARAHLLLGTVLNLTDRATQGIAECETALALDRNLADAHAMIGSAKHYIGRNSETEAHVNDALRLSPRDTFAFRWFSFCGFAKLHLAADEEAVAWCNRSIEANRNYPLSHFMLAAALALLGRQNQASLAVQAGLKLAPTFTIRRFRLNPASNNPIFLQNRQRIYEGMRSAGVPEA
jgi:TolB-like protein/Tfp pilus assembly protein PilF